jgi:hypothetical protein
VIDTNEWHGAFPGTEKKKISFHNAAAILWHLQEEVGASIVSSGDSGKSWLHSACFKQKVAGWQWRVFIHCYDNTITTTITTTQPPPRTPSYSSPQLGPAIYLFPLEPLPAATTTHVALPYSTICFSFCLRPPAP